MISRSLYGVIRTRRSLKCLVLIRKFHVGSANQANREWANISELKDDSRAFTVMSYNILAQKHLHTHETLYKKNDPKSLEWPTRLSLVRKEVEKVSPDILCLQEVEIERLGDIGSELKALNFSEPLYKKRSGQQTDGCAIFYNRNKFQLIEQYPIDYFRPGVRTLNRCNVAMAAKLSLKSSESDEVIVATTHLLFNPRRTDIRLAQLQVLLADLHRAAHSSGRSTPIVLTGDFNVQRNSEPYRLITGEKINVDRAFTQSNLQSDSCPAKLIPNELGITDDCRHSDTVNKSSGSSVILDKLRQFNTGYVSHNLNFLSTMATDGVTRVSSFHRTWIAVDYIFFSECNPRNRLQLIANYDLPTAEECEQSGPIPNHSNGSDHHSVAAKFQFN